MILDQPQSNAPENDTTDPAASMNHLTTDSQADTAAQTPSAAIAAAIAASIKPSPLKSALQAHSVEAQHPSPSTDLIAACRA